MKDEDDPTRKAPAAPSSKMTTYGLHRLAPPIRLVDAAAEIERADHMIGTVAGAKLRLLAEQIRKLQDEAKTIVAPAEQDAQLHLALIHSSETTRPY